MIKIILVLTTLFTSPGWAASDGHPITKKSFDNSLFQVGDLKQSLLDLTQFQASHGACWTLLDGSSISGSEFSSRIATQLPDGRGLFFRAKQNGRTDGKGNPDGEYNIGAFQGKVSNNTYQFQYEANQSNTSLISVPEDNSWSAYMTLAASGGDYARPFRARNRGGESRPDNLTVNVFVKINSNCE